MTHNLLILNEYLLRQGITVLQDIFPAILSDTNLDSIFDIISKNFGVPLIGPNLEVRDLSDNELEQIINIVTQNKDTFIKFLHPTEKVVTDMVVPEPPPAPVPPSLQTQPTDIPIVAPVDQPVSNSDVSVDHDDHDLSSVAAAQDAYVDLVKTKGISAAKGLWLQGNFIYLYAFFVTGAIFYFMGKIIFTQGEFTTAQVGWINTILGICNTILTFVIGFFFGDAWQKKKSS